eukprot:scaffold24999_cov63-Phaeocystis_antarctica.AAC.5
MAGGRCAHLIRHGRHPTPVAIGCERAAVVPGEPNLVQRAGAARERDDDVREEDVEVVARVGVGMACGQVCEEECVVEGVEPFCRALRDDADGPPRAAAYRAEARQQRGHRSACHRAATAGQHVEPIARQLRAQGKVSLDRCGWMIAAHHADHGPRLQQLGERRVGALLVGQRARPRRRLIAARVVLADRRAECRERLEGRSLAVHARVQASGMSAAGDC